MTVDELLAREAIRATMAAYTIAGDRLRTQAFVAVFTEDGVLETEGVAEAHRLRCVGRDEIAAWIGRWTDRSAAVGVHGASFVRHHLATSTIELVDAGVARARTYWTAYTDIGPDHGGVYVDAFRRVGTAWLIAHRRIREDWRAPGSLFGSAIAATR